MSESIRVLVVDDDALVRASLEMMLDGANGISVVGQAADGDEVPAAIDKHVPDLVLMDLRMPRVDGIVATRRLTLSRVCGFQRRIDFGRRPGARPRFTAKFLGNEVMQPITAPSKTGRTI